MAAAKTDQMILVADIGSTVTSVSAFNGLDGSNPRLAGQTSALTTVEQGDVRIGLMQALSELEKTLGSVHGMEMLASSSAAGGLSVTVHGLVHEMTVRAAREAALGAGAFVRLVTAGMLGPEDLERIEEIDPRLIFLAGGVDYGEERTVLENARRLAGLSCRAPVVYAGNVALQAGIAEVFRRADREFHMLPNVYPGLDQLVVEPTRLLMHRLFEAEITRAPGMDGVREMVNGRLIPTPGAVLLAAEALQEEIGDLAVVDVGGATTDVHSVTEGSPALRGMLIDPEPLAKRTVEADLCVPMPLGLDGDESAERTAMAVREAVRRHVGRLKTLPTPTGPVEVLVGRDLTAVSWIIGTGGALTRLPGGLAILSGLRRGRDEALLLPEQPRFALDQNNIMSACGVLLERWPRNAMRLLLSSLGLDREA